MNEPIVLDMGKIRLTVLSSHVKHLNKLWVLLLSDNQLTTLPDDIGELKELEMLLVIGNPVTLEKMKKGCENTEDNLKPGLAQNSMCVDLYLLGILFKISYEHPCLFYMGVSLLPRPHTKTVAQEKRIHI